MVASASSIQRFDLVKFKHLSCHGSDHAAIGIFFEANTEEPNKKHKHIFRFKKVWLKDPKCEALIEKLWNGARFQGHL